MLPPTEYEATFQRLLAELHAGRLDPEQRMTGAPPLSRIVRIEMTIAAVGLERALGFYGLDAAGWSAVMQHWGPALNAVEVHARRSYLAATLDVSADVRAILERG